MGIRREYTESAGSMATLKPLKRVAEFDDSSIRKMLRSAYDDFVGNELERYMNPLGSLVIPGSTARDLNTWAEFERFSNQAELKLFWDMFVQKQVFIFEQESAFLMNVDKEDW